MVSSSGPLWAAVGAAVAAAIAGIFALLTQRSKGQVEESVVVRGQWEKLTGSLSTRLAAVEREFAEFRQEAAREMADLRKRHSDEIDEMRRSHRAEMKLLREMNEGMQRQIIQNSHTTAQLVGDPEGTAVTQAARKERGEDR